MSFLNDTFGWVFSDSKKNQNKSKAAQIIPQVNDDAAFVIGANYTGHYQHQLFIDQTFENEFELIQKYREIALIPEVDKAINDIVNEAIVGDEESSPVDIVLDDLNISDDIKEKIRKEFDKVLELLNFNADAYNIFRKWYVDGRIAYLKIIDPKNPKLGIQEARHISSLSIKKIREEIKEKDPVSGIEVVKDYNEYFLYSKNLGTALKNPGQAIRFAADSISFTTSGLVDEQRNMIYSHLHKVIKPANKLRIMEDATIIYRLARAPERRVFYIDVGNLPKGKAEEYVQSIMKKHNQKQVYDAITGEVKDSSRTLSMMEDFWLPRREGGRGTEISTLPGGQNLGQMDDVEYFRKNLYQALNVPLSRIEMDQPTPFGVGRPGEVTRSEINFGRFIDRLQKEFSDLFKDMLRTQLLLKQIITKKDWERFKEKITFNFASDSYFTELKEAEILKTRMETLTLIEGLIGKYYSNTYVRKHILKQSDEDIKIMDKEILEEKTKQYEEQVTMSKKFPTLFGDDGEMNGPDKPNPVGGNN